MQNAYIDWLLNRTVMVRGQEVLLFCILRLPLSSETTPKSFTAAFPRCPPTLPARRGVAVAVGPMDSDLESLLTSHIESGGGGEGSNEERARKGSEDGRGVRKGGASVSRPASK